MADDQIEARRIIAEFKKRSGRQLTVTILFLIVIAGTRLLQEFSDRVPFKLSAGTYLVVYVVAIAGMLAFSLSNWRCPACNGYLGTGFDPTFCPKCGVRLQ